MEGRTIFSYQRDRFVPASELVMPFLDDVSGTIRGYRVFTACRTYKGKIFRLEDHLDRLYQSAASIYMQPPMDRPGLRDLMNEVVRRNMERGIEGDLLLDIVFSGGLDIAMKQSGQGAHLYIVVGPLEPPPPRWYERGMALATFEHQRICADVKLLNYIGAILAHQTVVPQHQADEVLFVDPVDRKTILEGSTFTVFFVDASGIIITPPLNGRILDSITRRVVLEILSGSQTQKAVEAPVSLDSLPSLAEAFIVSTSRNVVPVTRIDRHVFGDGNPGPVTKSMMAMFENYMNSY